MRRKPKWCGLFLIVYRILYTTAQCNQPLDVYVGECMFVIAYARPR